MLFALGVLTGITLCTFIAVLLKKFDTTIHRTIKQTESKLKKKGSIIEPEPEDLADWINELPK